MPIETLNDLFAALFRPGEGERPIIRQPRRPLREGLFDMFFPDALVCQYADKSKSNLTWFFTNDARNKSVRRSLVTLLRQDPDAVVGDMHRKCRLVLWPHPGRAVFDSAGLKAVLLAARIPGPLDNILRITAREDGKPGRLEAYYGADEAAALCRVILTLAVANDAPRDAMAAVWQGGASNVAFMAGDDSVEGQLRYCRMLDLQGRYERAFEGYEAIARRLDRPARTMDESTMYCRLGEMLFTGEGCVRDEKAAQGYDRLGCLDENPKSWHQLSAHLNGSEARQALQRAAELGYGPAIRQLGMAWYSGSARLACVRSSETARRWFQRGMSVPGADGAFCACMLGQVYENQGDREAAVNAYRVAREGGSAEAAERLARLDWLLVPEASAGSEEDGASGYCLVNGPEGCNRLFLEGLGPGWHVTVCGAAAGELPAGVRVVDRSPESVLRELSQKVYWGGAPQFPALVAAFLSPDRQRNLFQAVTLLGELQRLARSLGDRAWDLADQMRMYVLADHDEAALLLDAAMAGMDGLYFRVRLCDPALDAADRLLAGAPLFLTRLGAAEDAPVRLKIIGCGDVAMAVLRRAMALPLPEGAAFTVDVYGEGAGTMERRFRQLCPGLSVAGEALAGRLPRFHECAPEEALSGAPEGLAEGDYYVVTAGDDGLNLRLGALLQGMLLRNHLEDGYEPFIAVHTAHPEAQWLAGSLPAGAEAASAAWCGQYELYPFGALDMYAPRQLQSDALERRAQQVHMLFIGAPNTRDARHAAMASYYRRQSVRDSARLTALALPYRMHLAGLDLSGWRLYGVPEEERRLGAEYTRWLKQGDNLQSALRDEHLRRCRALMSLGWVPAAPEDVAAYVRRGNPGHIFYPARLDPFICPWEALEDGALLRQLREIVRARFPEKTVPDPRRDEEVSLKDTESMLDGRI